MSQRINRLQLGAEREIVHFQTLLADYFATPMMLNGRRFVGALSQPSQLGLLLTILLVALCLRLAWLVFITNGIAINGEGAEYARIAQNLVQGKGYMGIATEGRELMHPPLYPLLIAAISFVTLEFNLAAQLVSLIAGILLLLPLFGIARDLYGYKVAYIATVLAALNPILIKLSATTWVESLYIALVTTGLYFINRCWLLSKTHDWALAGSFFGLAYLTRPEAILFPPLFIAGLFLVSLLNRAKQVINFRTATIFFGGFLVLLLPYITFLSISTGTLRFEGKTLVNNELGQRLLSGVSYGAAGYEVTESLEEKGVWMRPNADFGRSPAPVSYRTMLQIMLSRGIKNLKDPFVDILRRPYLGAPLLFPLVVLGLFTGSWSASRLSGELVLMLALTGGMLPVTTIIHNSDSRYYYIMIPILLLWTSKGVYELPRLVLRTIPSVLRKTPSKPMCAQAVVALTILGF